MSRPPRVILLRTPRSPDPYREVLERAGFHVDVVPVLEFEFVHRDALDERLRTPDRYGGLVATSPRAVEAVKKRPGPLEEWIGRPFFAAGPETARRAADLGFSPVGREAGSAAELGQLIVERSFDRPLLFLSGNRRRETLPARLKSAGIPFEELVVYKTHLRRRLDWPLESEESPEWVVFFSPSGIEAAQNDGRISRHRVRKAAIGSTTGQALRAHGWRVDAVAAHPGPEALCEAITAAG